MATRTTVKNSINRRTLVTTTALGLAMAGAKASSSFAAPALLRQDTQITIQVWGGVPPENGPGDLITAFEEAFPDIKVNYTRYVNDDTGNIQLDTALQGGSDIDVFATYGIARLGQRIGAGATLNLDAYIASDAAVQEWVDTTEGIFVAPDGTHHTVPTFQAPNFVFLNKNKFDEAGIEIPTAWTIDEYVALAEELTTDMTFGTFQPPNSARLILGSNFMFTDDGTASRFDDPVFRESIERHKAMLDAGTAFPWTEVLSQDLKVYAQTPFLTEQNAIWLSSDYSLRFVSNKEEYPHEFVTSFAPVPTPVGVEDPWNGGTIGGWLTINSASEKADAGWEFIRFWLTQGGPYMLKAGNNPSFPGTDREVVLEGILGPDRDELYDVEAYARTVLEPTHRLVVDTITTAATEVNQIYERQTDRYLLGEISIDEWVTETKQQADDAIAAVS